MKDTFRYAALTTLAAVLFFSCESTTQKEERLAKKYCGTCHLFPDPALLDKKTWQKDVLPQMALRMGLDYTLLSTFPEEDLPEISRTLPSQAMVSDEAWKLIVNHFVRNAPDSIVVEKARDLPTPLQQFEATPLILTPEGTPFITLVRYDSITRKVFVGNRSSQLYKLNSDLKVEDTYQLDSPPTHVVFQKDKDLLITTAGVLDPNDRAAGNLSTLSLTKHVLSPLVYAIKRPVYTELADFNNDGLQDIAVAAFGNVNGALLIFEKFNETFKRHTVHSLPGTRKIIVQDFDGDGMQDILALISQGDEQITLFKNEGNFTFSSRQWLRFPPVYGSSYFEFVDMNGDGFRDIIYTNGDNMDYSTILKPYHGIRIFTNDGKNNFTESWFYAMHGASQVMARDFDLDNDIDLAAISFFPDFNNHPEQGFLYLENKGGKFDAQTTPLGGSGRWLTMETADIDQDHDIDILLGAMNFQAQVPLPLFQQWENANTDLVLLKNKRNP